MKDYWFTTDEETTARLSEQRDNIYDYVIERFKHLISENDLDDALALADEFFEWMNPDMLESEPTIFSHEQELRRRYLEIQEG
jgi:ketosteroid isomerase-like protein